MSAPPPTEEQEAERERAREREQERLAEIGGYPAHLDAADFHDAEEVVGADLAEVDRRMAEHRAELDAMLGPESPPRARLKQ